MKSLDLDAHCRSIMADRGETKDDSRLQTNVENSSLVQKTPYDLQTIQPPARENEKVSRFIARYDDLSSG